ncbi:MAG: NADH:ubiquinone oxidoreductase [bacterium]
MSKPRVAFFDFTCCEGCQLTVLNLETEILDIVGHIDIVNFREAMTERSDDYDIAFVEGSMSREADVQRVKKIRENAKILVALGACATTGGVNAMKNLRPMEDAMKYVYGDAARHFDTIPARPVDAVVKVDYKIHGCPISKKEFLEVTKALLLGKTPTIPNHPVCVECKLKENVCLYEKNQICMGPVTRAGCDAICPTFNDPCQGCRGFIDNPNINAEKSVLEKYGLKVEDVMRQFTTFNSYCAEVFK